ncbi:hypothetical protein PQX77_008776 [Marasmius sp. AFHP31]|nr:hypothetical protein PQX77_008776 [Marasmius sp. AFHP31]
MVDGDLVADPSACWEWLSQVNNLVKELYFLVCTTWGGGARGTEVEGLLYANHPRRRRNMFFMNGFLTFITDPYPLLYPLLTTPIRTRKQFKVAASFEQLPYPKESPSPMAPTTTKKKTSTSTSTTNQASGSRNPVAFGSTVPRSSEPSQPSTSMSTVTGSITSPLRPNQPARSRSMETPPPAPALLSTASTGSTETIRDDTRRRSDSHADLFGSSVGSSNRPSSSPSATPEELMSEMNTSAARKGKARMPNRPLVIGSDDDHAGDPAMGPAVSDDTDVDKRSRGGIQGSRGTRPVSGPSLPPDGFANGSGGGPSDNEPDHGYSGTGGRGASGRGGGPPGGPPSDPSGEPSDGEPHNSEDEHNRKLKKARTESATPPVAGPKPGVFGRTRYTSVDTTFNEREVFEYDPTPKTELEVLCAAFHTFEKLIERQLYVPGSSAPNNAQKAVIQNIPKPGFYYGDQDFLVFDTWIRKIVRWLSVANLCGEEVRWSKSRNAYVLTAIDMFRKNTFVSFLRGDARDWYVDVIESAVENDNAEPVTFMQVVSGLYRRFIHESSLSLVIERFDNVHYTVGKGAKGVFSELTRYAKSMPSPPDMYSFKKRLMLLFPENMEEDIRNIHHVTAESSSVDEIMQAALACEKSHKAGEYYQKAREEMKRAKRRKSCSRSRDRKKKDKKGKGRTSERSRSPKRLQIIDKRRYNVREHSPVRNTCPDYPKRVGAPPKEDKYQPR